MGGATELLNAQPDLFSLNLLSRRGFCRYALKYGYVKIVFFKEFSERFSADLVPMFNFGENNLYEVFPNPRGSKYRKFQVQKYHYQLRVRKFVSGKSEDYHWLFSSYTKD